MTKRSKSGHRKNEKSHHSKPKTAPVVTGKVQMTREGFAFITTDGQKDDIYIKASKTRGALHGDTVKAAITRPAGRGHRCEGEIIQIIERSERPFVGIMHFVGAQAWVLMQSKTMPWDIVVDQQQALDAGAQPGMKVAARVDGWKKGEATPYGHIVDVLGKPGTNETEMHAILAEFGLPYRFEPEVENAADQISEEITDKDLKGRKDFRDALTFTIDPADAKDFDDALSLRKLENGNYEVGVHIADVSYYVLPDTPVDKEAQLRGTSVYLVDRTVPMLPEKLCNKLCSLRPDEDKLTFSAVFEITPRAAIKSYWLGRTVIRSDRRMNYDEAQEIIERGTAAEGQWMQVEEAVLALNRLAAILREKRFAKGAINFERPEMKVEVDEAGKPVNIYQKISKEANWLIEEFMLLANRTVAEFIATGGKMNGVAQKNAKTFVYRVHAEPMADKLEGLRDFAHTFGYTLKTGEGGCGKALNEMLKQARGKAECSALEMVALRAMAKAAYTTDNIGHFGLDFKFYTHFTSPIRRYPDTMVHRLLALYLAGADSQNKGWYEEQCRHASEREQLAADAERASTKYKLVEFMQDKIGQEFEGIVSGVTEWGMYVEVLPTHIEGMVSLREIRDDYYEFDETHYRLVGKRSHRTFTLGDPVKVRVKSANLDQKLLDYELI